MEWKLCNFSSLTQCEKDSSKIWQSKTRCVYPIEDYIHLMQCIQILVESGMEVMVE